MNKYFKAKVFILLIIQFIVCLIVFISNDVQFNTILSLVQLIIQYVIIKYDKGKFITFTTIFITLSYILHMANLFITRILNYEDKLLNYNDAILNNSIRFFVICHAALIIGCTIHSKKTKKDKLTLRFVVTDRGMKKIGLFCTIVGIMPRVYIDINQIVLQVNGDYLQSVSSAGKYGIFGILAQFFYVGIVILLFTSKGHKVKARMLLFATCAWEVVTMLSGGRLYAISYIIVLLYIYCIRIEMPKFKHIFYLAVIGYFGLVFLNLISQIRTQGSFTISDLKMSASKMDNNPIYDALCEMGGTMKTLILCFINIPVNAKHGDGLSYIDSLLSLVPVYESEVADPKHLLFIYNFKDHAYLGGSWIGEIYYNFSWFGFIFCYFAGNIIGRFEKIFDESEENNNYFKSLIILPFLFYIILYLRDYFYKFNTIIQVCMVIFVIGCFVNTIKIKIKKK